MVNLIIMFKNSPVQQSYIGNINFYIFKTKNDKYLVKYSQVVILIV